MADTDLQALLDPESNLRGILLLRRMNATLLTSYYCEGNVLGKGKSMWVNVTEADSDADKNTAIRAAFGVG